MEFLEKDLEQIIWEASDNDLEDAGLDFYGKRFRQLRIGLNPCFCGTYFLS